jgi:hypothetical protein
VREIGSNLRKYSGTLGEAKPVAWVAGRGKEPVSALCSETCLFVVLLNSGYLSKVDSYKTAVLPLTEPEVQGELVLSPPPGVRVVSVTTLSSVPRSMELKGADIHVSYGFTGGGCMMVFPVSRESAKKPEEKSQLHPEPVGGRPR